MVQDLGPDSDLARRIVPLFYEKLQSMKSSKTEILFKDWRRVFTQVCSYSEDKLRGLERDYGIDGPRINSNLLLFAVHSYYVLVMKLLVAEITLLYRGGILVRSYLSQLNAAYASSRDRLREELMKLEHEGGIFTKEAQITNFLEADYFGWYVDEWDDQIADAVHALVKCLSDYEPGTAELESDRVKDLFKNLYQNLVNEAIRYALGEHYTPDWLAELTLDEAGFTVENLEKHYTRTGDVFAPLRLRILDPACGSGTFLVYVIRRLREYASNHFLKGSRLLSEILTNVVGFDLNPLAVMAARANFLIALGALLRDPPEGGITLPIYLADSILVERRTVLVGDGKRDVYVVPTEVAEFSLPTTVVTGEHFDRVITMIADCVSLREYSKSEFRARLLNEFPNIVDADATVLVELFDQLRRLETENKNKIWLKLLRNSCAPVLEKKFNLVVGNPPWVGWGELPQNYRERMRPIWERTGLIPRKPTTRTSTSSGAGTAMGRVRKELATLFVAVSLERYLLENEDGTEIGRNVLAFLLPFTTFKAPAEGEFRAMLADKTEIHQIHDLVTLRPFKRATNRTAMIVLSKKGKQKQSMFPGTMWKLKKGTSTKPEDSLKEVMRNSTRKSMAFSPVRPNSFSSPWMELSRGTIPILSKILGRSAYVASAGVYTAINGVYFVDVLESRAKKVLIRNLAEEGSSDKEGIPRVNERSDEVESEFVYPLARGRDLAAWECRPSHYILLPVDSRGRTLSSSKLRVDGLHCYKFLDTFHKELINRKALPYGPKLKPYRDRPKDRRTAEALAGVPPYWIFNAQPAMSRWKVAWKDVSGEITGKGVLQACVMGSKHDSRVGTKVIVPEHVVMFVKAKSEDEAHYLAAVLNSSVTRLIVAAYTTERHIGSHLTRYVRIPLFDPSKKAHQELVRCSKKAHSVGTEERLGIEEQIDRIVANEDVFGLTEDEVDQVRNDLKALLVRPS